MPIPENDKNPQESIVKPTVSDVSVSQKQQEKKLPEKHRGTTRIEKMRKVKKVARYVVDKGMTVTEAMQHVGYSKSTAETSPEIVTKHPAYQAEKTRLMAALERQDEKIIDRIAKRMREGLNAKKLVRLEAKEQNGLKTYKEVEVKDVTERRKHAELIAKAMGQLQEPDKGATGAINFNVLLQLTQQAERERGLK